MTRSLLCPPSFCQHFERLLTNNDVGGLSPIVHFHVENALTCLRSENTL